MEPLSEGDQCFTSPDWSSVPLDRRPPTTGEPMGSSSRNVNSGGNGDENLLDTPLDVNDGTEGGSDSSAANASHVDDMMEINVNSVAPISPTGRLEGETAPTAQLVEGENSVQNESPGGLLQMDNDFVGRGGLDVPVGDERRADIATDTNQPGAQVQAAEAGDGNPCKICLTNLEPQEFIYLNCGCLYCVDCLNAHFRSGLANRTSYPPRCCGQVPIDIEAIQGFLDDENMVRYTTVQEEFAAGRPLYCANKECEIDFIGDIMHIDLQDDERMVICYGCALGTCARCRELFDVHVDNDGVLECPDSLVLAEVKEMAEEGKWRRCPGCGFLVEKIDGCDHMICDCRTEFHYICGQEYGNDGSCDCVRNPGWDNGGLRAEAQRLHAMWALEDQLPPQVQADLHREEDFPFMFQENIGIDREEVLQNITEDTEILLAEFEDEDDASAIASTAEAAGREVVADEAAHENPAPQVVVEVGNVHRGGEGAEHEIGAVPADRMEEDNERDEEVNRQTANETLKTALADFRNAAAGLRTAAAAVVSGRRRRAERALRDLERADRARGRGAGRGLRGGRGRRGREGVLVQLGPQDADSDGEEQEDAFDELD